MTAAVRASNLVASSSAARTPTWNPRSQRLGTVASALLLAGRIPSGAPDGVAEAFRDGWPTEPLLLCAVDVDYGQRVVFGGADGPPGLARLLPHLVNRVR